jgi:hypothetical protein
MRVIAEGETDCKGYAVLAAAVGQALGFPAAKFAVYGRKGRHCFEHVVPVWNREDGSELIIDAQAASPGEIAAGGAALCRGTTMLIGNASLWQSAGRTAGAVSSGRSMAGLHGGFRFSVGTFLNPLISTAQSTIGAATSALQGQAGTLLASMIVPGGGAAAGIVAGTVNQTLLGGPVAGSGSGVSLDQVAAWIKNASQLPDGVIARHPATNNSLSGAELKQDAAYIASIPTLSTVQLAQRASTAQLQIDNAAGQPSGTNNPWTKVRAAIFLAAIQGELAKRENNGTAPPINTVPPATGGGNSNSGGNSAGSGTATPIKAGMSTAAKVGIGVAAAAGVALVATILYFATRKKKGRRAA